MDFFSDPLNDLRIDSESSLESLVTSQTPAIKTSDLIQTPKLKTCEHFCLQY